MDYNEFANKIKAKYPDYSDMSNEDLARAMMKKYPEYSDVDTSGIDKAAPAAQSGYAYNSPDDYTNLYNNAKLKGYSGLSDAEKDLFNKSFSASKAAQSGMTLEQAQAATDAGAQVPPPKESIINSIGKGIRKLTALPETGVATALAGAQGLINYDSRYNPDDTRLSYAIKQAKEEAPIAYQKGITGEGLEGTMADPVAIGTLGLGGASLLPKIGPVISSTMSALPEVMTTSKLLPATIRNGLVGGALTNLSTALNPSEEFTPSKVVNNTVGGVLSGAIPTLAGAGLTKFGINQIPNKQAYENYLAEHGSTLESAPSDASQNLANLINQTRYPTQRALINQNEANRVAAGEGMGKALAEAVGSRPTLSSNDEGMATIFNMPQKAESFKAPKLNANSPAANAYNEWGEQNINFPHGHSEYGKLAGWEEPTVYTTDRKGWFNENEWEDIKNKAMDFYREQQRANPTAPSMKAVTKQINSRIEDLSAKTALRKPEYPAGSLVVGRINPETGDIEKIPLPAIRSVEDVSRQKHAVTSQFRPTNNKERAAMEADEAVHEAITRRLNEVPGYEEAAKPYMKQYKIAKGLENYILKEPPNPRGLARQYPALLNNYGIPVSMVKGGQMVRGPMGNAILSSGLNAGRLGLDTLTNSKKKK